MRNRRRSNAFQPSAVASLEERIVLNATFHFPAGFAAVDTFGLHGNRVLTSRTYGNIQHSIDKAFHQFSKDFTKAFAVAGGYNAALDTALGATGGPYKTGLLGKIDLVMKEAESHLPYGLGRGANNPTGGAGLSYDSSLTSWVNTTGSVASQLEAVLASPGPGTGTLADGLKAIEQVRKDTLAFGYHGNAVGALPNYLTAEGANTFGLRNSR